MIVDGQLDLKVFCNNDLSATFVIKNVSGTVSDGAYSYSDPSGKTDSGSLNLQPGDSTTIQGAGNGTVIVTYKTTKLASVTLKVTGSCIKVPPTATPTNTPQATSTPTNTPTATPTNTPVTPPALSASGACSNVNTGTATFIITNNGGDMPSAYNYEIKDSGGTVVDSGTFQLSANQSTTVTFTGSSTSYTLSSPDDSGLNSVADMTLCVPPTPTPIPPLLSASGYCDAGNGAKFIITNNGGNMPSSYNYEIKDNNNNIVDSGSFQLKAGESTTINYAGNAPSYTITSVNDSNINATADLSTCVKPPALTVSGACTANSGVATFIVTNNGGDMPKSYTYEILDAGNGVVQTSTFQLKAGESVTITFSGSSNSYTFSSPDDSSLKATADMTTCKVPPPALTVSGACTANSGVATFIVTNTGGNMPTAYDYEIKDANGAPVQSATFQLNANQSITLTVSGSSTSYTFSSPDDSSLTTVADMTACIAPPPPPALTANGVCIKDSQDAAFNITNNGGNMTVPYLYEVTDSSGNVVQSGSIQLNAGQSMNLIISGNGDDLILTITDANKTTTRAALASCYETIKVLPASSQPCIECLVFHTFRDDNLEVYRLDGIEGQPGFKLYNLSKDGSVDSRPSRAPNDSWVVFQSNRDGNVELYYTDLVGSGEAIQLTDSQSNNTNPMYGPDSNTVVFQSDRNGRFDLFTIDQTTGKETQITSDPADDVNAFYSPDLKYLVFQSNRNNNWDLFILDVETGTEYQLTDSPTDETFPGWSPNGKQIAFLSNENGATDLYVIDVDGSNLKRITVDGATNNPVWSPEGNRIAYQSERNGNLDIYSYDLLENKEYRVTDYEGVDSGPTWDCGGTNLAFTSMRDGDPNIFQVFWQGGSASNMTIDPATDKWSQWRPSNDVSSIGY